MKLTTTGLVIKEVKLREADRILTLMTPDQGILSASARGSLRPGNKLFSASGLFCYSEWTLHEGKTMYSVDEAAPIEVFFGLRQSIEAVSLAAYIAELLQILSPTGQEAAGLLRLALNSLFMLSEGRRPPALVKAVFELRSLSQSGFMPDLFACYDCDSETTGPAFFDISSGSLYCGECAQNRNLGWNLGSSALAALRHIVLGDDDKLYAFTLSGDSLVQLCRIAEAYTLFHLDWPPKTLDFLKSVL